MRIVDVKASRKLYLIGKFLKLAGMSLKTFGYYSKRDLSAVENHIITLVGLDEVYIDVEDLHSAAPAVYGHLDRDGDTVWLGICVAEGYTGFGLGATMMQALLDAADSHGIREVTLGVHDSNIAARNLYERFGFVQHGEIVGRQDLVRMVRRRT